MAKISDHDDFFSSWGVCPGHYLSTMHAISLSADNLTMSHETDVRHDTITVTRFYCKCQEKNSIKISQDILYRDQKVGHKTCKNYIRLKSDKGSKQEVKFRYILEHINFKLLGDDVILLSGFNFLRAFS